MKTLLKILLALPICLPSWAVSEVVFIVNSENSVTELSTFQITEMFLKKHRTWPNGESVRFFDRAEGSVERKSFLAEILRKSSRDLDQYWIGQKLYTGNSEPSQLASDRIALAMVSRFPGAISYVLKENFEQRKGVKKVEVSGEP